MQLLHCKELLLFVFCTLSNISYKSSIPPVKLLNTSSLVRGMAHKIEENKDDDVYASDTVFTAIVEILKENTVKFWDCLIIRYGFLSHLD